jgi:hypothetical protein
LLRKNFLRLALVTALVSMVLGACGLRNAGQDPGMRPDPSRIRATWFMSGAVLLLLGAPASAQTETSGPPSLLGEAEASLREITRQINNPISPLWQVTFDNSLSSVDGGGLDDELAYTGALQPFMPIALSEFGLGRFAWARDYRVITQLTLPVFQMVPLPPGPEGDLESGFGDIQLASVLAPSATSGWVWGVGPTFIFPSASNGVVGQEKWQAGPAVVGGYLGSKWTAYAVAQQWWSFAGDDSRPRTSQLCLNYVLLRSFGHTWQVGMQPSIEVDWTESDDNKLLLPVGLGVGKTVRIGGFPVQLWVEADYYAVRPDDLSSPRWGIDFQIIPVIGELF